MKKLRKKLEKIHPSSLIVISPHGPVFPDQMSIKESDEFKGSFANFGAGEVNLKFKGDIDLAQDISSEAQKLGIPTVMLDHQTSEHYGLDEDLDHGSLVPLYYLAKNLDIPLVPISFSFLSLAGHLKFGQAVARACVNKSVGIIASGDLSHCLDYDAPGGYSPYAKDFDKKLIELLKKNDVEGILNFDPKLIEEAGECGLRSIIILLGALSKIKNKPQILSYEGPFGVGYLVADFNLNQN